MLVIFQRPIADLRWLMSDQKGLLPPEIPGITKKNNPGEGERETINIDTLPHFGWADIRLTGASQVFPDEYSFYSAHNAIKFVKGFGKRVFDTEDTKFQKKLCLIRRLFISSAHYISARVELSLAIRAESSPLKFAALIQLLDAFLSVRTAIPLITPKNKNDNKSKYIKLLNQGQALAEHYALATSQWQQF